MFYVAENLYVRISLYSFVVLLAADVTDLRLGCSLVHTGISSLSRVCCDCGLIPSPHRHCTLDFDAVPAACLYEPGLGRCSLLLQLLSPQSRRTLQDP